MFQILTKDSVTVVVDAVIYARVDDATLSVVNIEDARVSTHLLGATTLRTILGTVGLSELLSDRERIDKHMQASSFCYNKTFWSLKRRQLGRGSAI